MKLLNIDSMFHLKSLQNRRFVELLTSPQFLNNTSLFEFSLKLLQGSFNVLAFFYGYYNHFFRILLVNKKISACKVSHCFINRKTFGANFISFARFNSSREKKNPRVIEKRLLVIYKIRCMMLEVLVYKQSNFVISR